MSELWLIPTCFLTSLFSAVAGMGGGLMLVALMPFFLPAPVVIPVHGVVQFVSNFSRFAFSLKDAAWRFVIPFASGAVIGSTLASQIVLKLQTDYFPIILGGFILIVLWFPIAETIALLRGRFFTTGTVQGFCTMFVGAAGPIGGAVLYREELKRDAYITTAALFASASHGLKVIAFLLLGVSFASYWKLMLAMSAAVILGSYSGIKLRNRVCEKIFRKILLGVLTVLAVRMVGKGVWGFL